MPRTPEHRPSEPATPHEQQEIEDCYKYIDSRAMSAKDVTFIAGLKGRKDNYFTVLLSDPQRKWLSDIWHRLYDKGIIT